MWSFGTSSLDTALPNLSCHTIDMWFDGSFLRGVLNAACDVNPFKKNREILKNKGICLQELFCLKNNAKPRYS